MDKLTERILTQDSLAESENVLGGKHWSQFNETEQAFSMFKFFNDNDIKNNHLQSINDTYFRMSWDEFKNLIKSHGFIPGLEYNLLYNGWSEPKTEEAILYYHPSKGLIIWATSFNGKTTVNGGNLYGEIKANSKEDCETIWRWLSSGGCINSEEMIYKTSHDVREGLFSKLNTLESAGTFLSKWIDKNRFLCFVDYVEDDIPGYDYKAITKEKIMKCPKEMQEIIGINK